MRQQSLELDDACHRIVEIATAASIGMLYNFDIFGRRCECQTHRRSIESQRRILEDS